MIHCLPNPSCFTISFYRSHPFEGRVDGVLSWFDLPEKERPSLVTLYFDEPESTGDEYGTGSPQVKHLD